ncbi:MAG: UDP-N-acetylmuramoyl-L-alanyl-D-glutamate--2,6-diaminopimelate ligase, partial [Clostridia bacterium]|nr:UDP-N-acetylmuramoyl-L-alanyl-D-glutamate--2,6-diaminopimelate ligase [Clostridia bacterium]
MGVYKKTVKEIASYLGSKIKGGKEGFDKTPVYRIEYDSRKVESGDIFVCLTGHKSDGHKYATMAYGNGCRVFLCEYAPNLPNDAAVILVDDTRAALASLSAYFYDFPANKLKLIGITGTKGKTTTALLVSSILNLNGKNCAYIGSNGVIINGKHTETVNTTPESRDLHHYFAMMVDGGVEYAALEVSSQALAHHRVDGIDFGVKVFTNLSPDHIGDGEHKDFEDYKKAKASFFSGYDGCVIYNSDDPEAESVINGHADSANVVSFGMSDGAIFRGMGGELYRDETTLGIEFGCLYKGESTHVKLRSPGAFSVYNGLAAIAAVNQMGVSVNDSANALKNISV